MFSAFLEAEGTCPELPTQRTVRLRCGDQLVCFTCLSDHLHHFNKKDTSHTREWGQPNIQPSCTRFTRAARSSVISSFDQWTPTCLRQNRIDDFAKQAGEKEFAWLIWHGPWNYQHVIRYRSFPSNLSAGAQRTPNNLAAAQPNPFSPDRRQHIHLRAK